MKNLIRTILIVITVIINSCGEGITEPQPGRRDYVWTRDTLRADEFGFQFLSGIWGSSPSDLWVVGDAATYKNKVWHYDGSKWSNYLLDQFATPIGIWGISSSEIWMVTTISDIWKYDGTKWFKDTTIVPEGYQRILFEDIYGYENNMYAVGIAEKADGDYTGIIVHYTAGKWKILNTPQIKEYFVSVMFLRNFFSSSQVIITARNFFDLDEPCRLYKLKDEKLTLISNSKMYFHIGILNNRLYVDTNSKVYEYSSGGLNEVLDLTGTNYAGSLWGRTIKDFFTANYGWNLGHYNGKDLVNIYTANGNIIAGQIFDRDVFFICHTLDNVDYILHGKLK
ncbi:hypothetical protein ABRY23_11050 [Melioribacteraceae bacterium 4301-Me]|uniref:hypothetical protein n=1 Tax=Pyranulibacter aquaticus TaxID=3163344 RepID=UPI003595E262